MSNEKNEAPIVGAVEVYHFSEKDVPVRGQLIDGEPWFVAKDVAEALQYSNPRKAISDHCKEKGVTFRDTLTEGGVQKLKYINEGNMYRLIVNCTLPMADVFEEWIFDKVIPTLRKTGRYELPASSAGVSAPVRVRRRSRSELVNADLLNLLWLIGESLRQGEIRDVALELGVSRQTVSKVLNGYARNPRVLMALYNRAKANRACGMIYHRPDVMAERLIDAENGDVVVQLPSVVYGSRKKGGQIGNQNARKHWRKESK